jgi:hypothetical protein
MTSLHSYYLHGSLRQLHVQLGLEALSAFRDRRSRDLELAASTRMLADSATARESRIWLSRTVITPCR